MITPNTNQCLIAAAPSMLEALERIRDATAGGITPSAAEELCDVVFDIAAAAIAEATSPPNDQDLTTPTEPKP